MEGVTMGAVVITLAILAVVFTITFRHIAKIDRERHMPHGRGKGAHAH